jgi:hypothetical protein
VEHARNTSALILVVAIGKLLITFCRINLPLGMTRLQALNRCVPNCHGTAASKFSRSTSIFKESDPMPPLNDTW